MRKRRPERGIDRAAITLCMLYNTETAESTRGKYRVRDPFALELFGIVLDLGDSLSLGSRTAINAAFFRK